MRIGVLTGEFPSVSETFVMHHVCDLLAAGHQVEVFPERETEAPVRHAELTQQLLLAHRHLPPPMPTGRWARVADATRLAVSQPAARPGALLRSVNPFAFGRRGLSLSLWYRQLPLRGRGPFDIVHCHHGPVGLAATELMRLGVLRGPLVVSFHGFDVNVAARDRRGLYAPVFRRADLLLANSEFLRARLLALGAPADRVVRHPVGVAQDDFAPLRRHRESAPLRIASVGRLVEVKGFEYALRAFARLGARFPELRYVLIGDGPLRPRLEALAHNLGIADRVQFTGALSHDAVRWELSRSHVLCHPAIVGRDGAEESQGLAVIEAQAAGLPVVATTTGGLPESLREDRTGLLVAPRDVRGLEAALERLVSAPRRRTAMGDEARRFAREHFDRAQLCQRLQELYAEVRADPRAPTAPARRIAGLRAKGSESRSSGPDAAPTARGADRA